MPRELNKEEKKMWALYCTWREYCPKYKPLENAAPEVHPALIKMVCSIVKCKLRENTLSDTTAKRKAYIYEHKN
jgi:hypothetical protein